MTLHPLQSLRRSGVFGWLYTGMLFLSLFLYTLQYVNAPLLEQYIPVQQVGVLFAIASLLSAMVLFITPTLISMFGTYKTTVAMLLLMYTATLLVAWHTHPGILFAGWTLYFLLVPVIHFLFDIFLENSIKNETHTGRIRGIFLTMGAIAAITTPLLASFLIGTTESYSATFLVAASFLIPVFIIVAYRFSEFIDPPYAEMRLTPLLETLRTNKNIRNVTIVQFLLQVYFAAMVIYLPIYLYQHIGMPWSDIGIVLFIMLTPYLLLEIPAGIIADQVLGEKEMLVFGILITVASTIPLSFITTPSLILWSAGLFATRVGSALIHTMCEVYFFKMVDARHTDIITAFRLMQPLAVGVAPILVGVFLIVAPLHLLWLGLGVLMLCSIPAARALRDTR